MRKLLWVLMSCGIFGVKGQDAAGIRALTAPDTLAAYPLSVTERFTTNLLFPSPIFKVDLGTGDVLARKMGQTENVLLLKANRPGMASTNVSVYLTDGRFYSFLVRYADSLTSYNYSFCPGAPRALFTGAVASVERLDSDAVAVAAHRGRLRVGGSDGSVSLRLKGLFLKDGLMWMSFRARNRSSVDFLPGGMRFAVQDRKRVRRTAVQSIEVQPVYVGARGELAGGGQLSVVAALHALTVGKGKQLVVEWREANGGRRVRLVIRGKHLLRAKKID